MKMKTLKTTFKISMVAAFVIVNANAGDRGLQLSLLATTKNVICKWYLDIRLTTV